MKSTILLALISSLNVFASDVPTEVTLREIAKKSINTVTILDLEETKTSKEINNSNRNIEKDFSATNNSNNKTIIK